LAVPEPKASRADSKGDRVPRKSFAWAIALLAACALIWAAVQRDALRERWLASQSIPGLERLNAEPGADVLTRLVYAERLLDDGDAAKALAPAVRAAEGTPPDARDALGCRALALAGLLNAQLGDAKQASVYLDRAERIDSRCGAAAAGRAVLALRAGRLSEGIAGLERAASLDPHRPDTWRRLGSAYLVAAAPERAAECYEREASLRPRSPQAHADLAEALGRLGRFDRATAEAEEAGALAPDRPEFVTLAAISRASSARTSEEYDVAARALQAAIDRFPDIPYLHALLAGLHARFIQFSAARREVEIYLRSAPRDSNGWLNLATVCERLGDRPAASTAMARYRWIADAGAEATRLKQQAVLRPADPALLQRLAGAMERSGRYREAVAALTRAAELKPYDAELRRQLTDTQSAAATASSLEDTARAQAEEPH